MRGRKSGFTLAELLLTMSLVALLTVLFARLIASATTITTAGQKRLNTDTQARQIFDRMAIDFAQMVKRSDVDCYVKGSDAQIGNDRIAFFAHLPGYYPSSGSPSSVSVVAYRVNESASSIAYMKLQRMGKGLLWNGVSPSNTPLVFGPSATLQTNWPSATAANPADPNYGDPDYETFGPYVFRLEYFYQLTDGSVATAPSGSGIPSISAISACIAVIDPRSKIVLTDAQLNSLAGRMTDYATSFRRDGLLAQWQTALDTTTDMPRSAVSGVRLYQRDFYLR